MKHKNNMGTVLLVRLIGTGVVFLLLFIGLGISKCTEMLEEQIPEVEFSAALEENTPVYVDIVSIEPVYCITDQPSGYIRRIICRCETVSRNTVWIFLSTTEYEENFDSTAKFYSTMDSHFEKVTFTNPVRIHGKIRGADGYRAGLSKQINDKVIIQFVDQKD